MGLVNEVFGNEKIVSEMEYRIRRKPKVRNGQYICPSCGLIKSLNFRQKYCGECGQAFDWEAWMEEIA